ncbi:MAG: VWA domain-containing protein [Thermoanaerobaculia bacterium]|nr:VWA domain-containing protein [Thermoanaerobaculia bacterium]
MRMLPLWLGLLLAMPSVAQEALREAPLEIESVDVDVVNIEVYVTDSKGRTVDGLTKADFRLFVDHQPVEPSNFFRAERGPGESVPPEGRPILDPTVAEEPPLTLVIYVDHLQLTPTGRQSYLTQIREFLEGRLLPGDHLMLVSHDRGLQIEQPFSEDLEAIFDSLEGLWKAPGGALAYDRQYQHALDQIENILLTTPQETEEGDDGEATVDVSTSIAAGLSAFSDPCGRVDRMLQVARSYGEWVASQVGRSLDNLDRLTRALGGIEGRKAVLYLSNGLDQTPGLDMQYQVADLCPNRTFQTVGTELSTRLVDATYRLASLANTHRVTFYSLDASRLAAGATSGIERAARLTINGRSFELRPSAAVDARRREGRQATLLTLAQETGGMAILNANEIGEDLGRIEDSLRRFYSLGFTPRSRVPGTTHLLRIELAEPRSGHTLHYRRTYTDPEPVDRSRSQLMSALLLGYEENPLGVSVEVGEYRVGGDGIGILPLRIVVPFGKLGWLEEEGFRDGRLELMVGLQEGLDGKVGVRSKVIPIRIKEELWPQVRQRTHPIELALPVPSESTRFAFAVIDHVSHRTSFLSPRDDSSPN